jgi:hypothetical protein
MSYKWGIGAYLEEVKREKEEVDYGNQSVRK